MDSFFFFAVAVATAVQQVSICDGQDRALSNTLSLFFFVCIIAAAAAPCNQQSQPLSHTCVSRCVLFFLLLHSASGTVSNPPSEVSKGDGAIIISTYHLTSMSSLNTSDWYACMCVCVYVRVLPKGFVHCACHWPCYYVIMPSCTRDER